MKMGTEAVGEGYCTGPCVTKPSSVGLQKGSRCLAVGCNSLGLPQGGGDIDVVIVSSMSALQNTFPAWR